MIHTILCVNKLVLHGGSKRKIHVPHLVSSGTLSPHVLTFHGVTRATVKSQSLASVSCLSLRHPRNKLASPQLRLRSPVPYSWCFRTRLHMTRVHLLMLSETVTLSVWYMQGEVQAHIISRHLNTKARHKLNKFHLCGSVFLRS